MSAPDPTAGEHDHEWTRCSACRTDGPCPCSGEACALCPASPPAVAASTGTSEDAEALARLLSNAYHVGGSPSPVDRRVADAVLASDWLAAQKAAARAEIVAGVRAWCAINEIAAPPLDWEGLGEFLARVAGEARP